MHRLADEKITKMNGLGNEIVILDLRGKALVVAEADARAIARAAPFDQMMVLRDPRGAEAAFMEIYNADGSRAGACGNGTRCVAAHLLAGTTGRDILLATDAGPLACKLEDKEQISVDMGQPRFGWRDIPLALPVEDTRSVTVEGFAALGPGSAVDMGNPHVIFWLERPERHDLAALGPQIERHSLFPDRVNVSFACVRSASRIDLAVWERGAGLTRACGSAACATLVAAARKGLTGRRAEIMLPGGALTVEWRADDRVLMTGPVEFEFERALTADVFSGAAA